MGEGAFVLAFWKVGWHMDNSRKLEEQRLDQELRKLEAQIAALKPEERAERVAAMRIAVAAQGGKLSAADELVLQKFEKGELGLDQLAAHFHGRI